MTRSLGLKLIVCVIATLAAIFGLFGYQTTELHRRHLEEINFASADRISDSIKSSILWSMQLNQREHIYHTIKVIGNEPGINKIRIFNEIGNISYSSDDAEIDTMVDKRAEACYACHAQEEPLHRLDRPDRTRIYTDAEGNRILGLINAIENQPACYNASCHVHSPEQRVLGVLDVTMSLAYVDMTIREGRAHFIYYLVSSIALVTLILAALVWFMVHKPTKRLIEGAERVAAGELDYQISISSRDEMGVLGTSFNRMTTQLKQARDELKDWALTLENRVEQKTAELQRAHQQMIQVERMASMGKLAAIVAHEINNPLLGILTSARLVIRRLVKTSKGDDPDTMDQLEMIASEASRCGEIVKNLLQFARPKRAERSEEDLNRLLQDSVRLIKHKIDLMGVDTIFELDERLPGVLCDPQGIRQVFVAILINAAEAVGDGAGGTILLTTASLPEEESVEVIIQDNGCGMDEQTQNRIFEPFFTTKEEVRGVGLGLAVVAGIVSSHGGTIEVTSSVGVGTTVTIRLPLTGKPAGETVIDELVPQPDVEV